MEIMKHVQAIEYRNKTEQPTEAGWYYARHKEEDCGIVPYHVTNLGVGKLTPLVVWHCSLAESVEHYDFFGPVRIVKEG